MLVGRQAKAAEPEAGADLETLIYADKFRGMPKVCCTMTSDHVLGYGEVGRLIAVWPAVPKDSGSSAADSDPNNPLWVVFPDVKNPGKFGWVNMSFADVEEFDRFTRIDRDFCKPGTFPGEQAEGFVEHGPLTPAQDSWDYFYRIKEVTQRSFLKDAWAPPNVSGWLLFVAVVVFVNEVHERSS